MLGAGEGLFLLLLLLLSLGLGLGGPEVAEVVARSEKDVEKGLGGHALRGRCEHAVDVVNNIRQWITFGLETGLQNLNSGFEFYFLWKGGCCRLPGVRTTCVCFLNEPNRIQ